MTERPTETIAYGERLRRRRAAFEPDDIVLNRYKVRSLLGKGGMGAVFLCRDTLADIDVALKTLPPDLHISAEDAESLRENFKLIERLHHPNIVAAKTLEFDADTNQIYLIMEYVDGISLHRRMRQSQGRIHLDEALAILKQIAEALDYAHRQGIAHRDIKPSNILVPASGTVKVLDFGLATRIQASLSRASAVHHGTGGTASYMAPEQWRGGFQDGLTDQYALGVLACELLSGRLPFDCPDTATLREAVLNETFERIDDIPEPVAAVLRKAMAKERRERYPSCSVFVSELQQSCLPGIAETPKRPLPHARLWHWSIAAAVLVLGIVAFHMRLRNLPEDRTLRADAPSGVDTNAAQAPPVDSPAPPAVQGGPVSTPTPSAAAAFSSIYRHRLTGNAFDPNGSATPSSWNRPAPLFATAVDGFAIPTDITGDGRLDLLVGEDYAISVLSSSGERLWRKALSSATDGVPCGVALSDFSGDGQPEIAVSALTAEGRMELLFVNGDGTARSRFFIAGSTRQCVVQPIATLDLDGSGTALSVAFLAPGNVLRPRELRIYEAESGLLRYAYPIPARTARVVIGDVRGNGFSDIFVAGDASHDRMTTEDLSDRSAYLTALSPTGHLWNAEMGTDRLNVTLGDLSGDGVLDIVSGRSQVDHSGPHELHVIDPDTGLSRLRCLVPIDSRSELLPNMAIGPFASDGAIVLLVAYRNGQLVLFDQRLQVLRLFSVGHTINGMLVNDLDGNGEAEIVLLNGRRIRALDQALKELWSYEADFAPRHLAAADLRGDGRNVLVLSGGQVMVLAGEAR